LLKVGNNDNTDNSAAPFYPLIFTVDLFGTWFSLWLACKISWLKKNRQLQQLLCICGQP